MASTDSLRKMNEDVIAWSEIDLATSVARVLVAISADDINMTTEVIDETFSNATEDERMNQFIDDIRDSVFIELVVYIICFVIGSISNLWAFYKLSLRANKNRVNYLIRHLTFADLMVVFFAIFAEIIWRISIRWKAGLFVCKVLNVVKAFTLYLSSNIIVCISLDRYYAFVRPLGHINFEDRNRRFLLTAYIMSLLFSLPQVSGSIC